MIANKGAAGIDRMTVERLQPHLKGIGRASGKNCWKAATGRSRCAGWKSPSLAEGCAQLGIPTVVTG